MHSLVIVAETEGTNYKALLEPYWNGLAVEKWLIGPVSEELKMSFLDYYNRHRKPDTPEYTLDKFDEVYEQFGEAYNDNMWEKEADGKWYEYSDFNPESKWDYYRVGGRYVGRLKVREGAEEIAPLNFTWEWDGNAGDLERLKNATPKRADRARLKDIINLEELTAEAVVTEDGWQEIPSSNWEFGLAAPYLRDLPGDTIITCIDFHD